MLRRPRPVRRLAPAVRAGGPDRPAPGGAPPAPGLSGARRGRRPGATWRPPRRRRRESRRPPRRRRQPPRRAGAHRGAASHRARAHGADGADARRATRRSPPPRPTATPPAATATPATHPGGAGDAATDDHPGGDGDAARTTATPVPTATPPAATATATAAAVATATATAGPITITPSKTLACGTTGPPGSFTGEVTVTVAGGQVRVLSYMDWIEYEVPGAPGTWARVPTTVQPEPPIAFPVTLEPGEYTVGYQGTYTGVPAEATQIRNVLVVVTDLPGEDAWNALVGLPPGSGAYGTSSPPVAPCSVGPTSTPTGTPPASPTSTPTGTPPASPTSTPIGRPPADHPWRPTARRPRPVRQRPASAPRVHRRDVGQRQPGRRARPTTSRATPSPTGRQVSVEPTERASEPTEPLAPHTPSRSSGTPRRAASTPLDYLTTFNRTVTNANPCVGRRSGATRATFTTFPIPADPQVTGAGVTPVAGRLHALRRHDHGGQRLHVPQRDGLHRATSRRRSRSPSPPARPTRCSPGAGTSPRALDWGAGNSAVAISGSPYHMRLIDLDGSGGNQDRSLSAAAVIFPGSITIIKDAAPNGPQDFGFTATGASRRRPSPWTTTPIPRCPTRSATRNHVLHHRQNYTFTESRPSPAGR